MGRKVGFGVRLPVAGPLAGPDSIRTAAQTSDSLGYDHLWVNDYITWSQHENRTHISSGGSAEAIESAGPNAEPQFYESLTNLAFVAGITSRARLGVSVLVLPWRNPVIAAKQVANIDNLSGGRLILGIGVGAPRTTGTEDFEVLSVPRGDKYKRTRDYFSAMRAIWTEQSASYSGEFVSFSDAAIFPKPKQKPHPPIWVGGSGPKALDITAQFGTGWIPGGVLPSGYPERISELRSLADGYGRGDLDFDIAASAATSIARTSEEARANALRTLQLMTVGFSHAPTIDQVLEQSLVGSPAEIGDRVSSYFDNGVTELELRFVYHSIAHLLEQLAMFKDEVLTKFR